MSENFTAEELAEFSPEQREEIQQIENAVEKFLADPRTIRYIETQSNQDALLNFLTTHGLDITHRNLLFAFDSLQGELELVPFATPMVVEVEQQPAPAPPESKPAPAAPAQRAPLAWRNGKLIELTNARPL